MATNNFFKALRCTESVFSTATAQTISRRTFTSSAVLMRHGSVPVFKPASSPELDEQLNLMRTKVLLPNHVSKEHQRLIYGSPERTGIDLATEPVQANVDGEVFRLEHIDQTTDIPSSWRTICESIRLARTKEDYDNVVTLLIGLKDVGFKLNRSRSKRLIALLGYKSREDIVLDLARRQKNTGFTFFDSGIMSKWISAIHRKTFESGADSFPPQQALVWLEMTNSLAQEPDRRWKVPSHQMYGVLLDLSAIQATRSSGGKDTDGKVADYAAKLLASPAPPKAAELASGLDKNSILKDRIPILHGCKLALPILASDPSIAEKLKAKISNLELEVEKLREELKRPEGEPLWGGLIMYNKILGPEAI